MPINENKHRTYYKNKFDEETKHFNDLVNLYNESPAEFHKMAADLIESSSILLRHYISMHKRFLP